MTDRVIIDPAIQHGKPIIKGTRVPITRISGGLSGGMSKEAIPREYQLREEDISAALEYASTQKQVVFKAKRSPTNYVVLLYVSFVVSIFIIKRYIFYFCGYIRWATRSTKSL